MRLFRVVYDEDGQTIKEPGVTQTEIKRMSLYFAADSIEQVWDAVAWIRGDPERQFIAIVEDAPMIQVIDAAREAKP